MPPDGVVERLAAAARSAALAPSATDISDALWLADQMGPADIRVSTDPSGEDQRPSTAAAPEGTVTTKSPAEPLPGETEPVDAPREVVPADQSAVEVVGPEVEVRRVEPQGAQPLGVPFRAPTAPALARLSLARALRPFKRHVPSTEPGELDADATAHEAALNDIMLPIFAPAEGRWLDVAVVADRTHSMAVSGQTVRELIGVIYELGAFRDVRVWNMNSDSAESHLTLTAEGTSASFKHAPSELIDSQGRRVVLVVSDCLGDAWCDGRMAAALEIWAKAGPVAVVQPLPQRLWDDIGPTVRSVALSSVEPVTANANLKVEPSDEPIHLLGETIQGHGSSTPGVVVPLIELGVRWLASWARLVTGETDRPYRGRALFTGLMDERVFSGNPEAVLAPRLGPREIVTRFNATASLDAARLAPLLAAAAPLTLPVMRLVQHAKLPSAAPTALREVFLGGLLEQVTESAADPEETVYDFVRGTRQELIGSLTRQDALSVLVEVSRYLVSRMGTNLDFLALLAAQHPVADLDQRARAFAAVAVDVLESIGGSYRQKAARLRELLNREQPSYITSSDNRSNLAGGPSMTHYTSPAVFIPARESGYAPAGWKTVPPQNVNFVGRDDMLSRMRAMLVNSAQTAVLLPRALYGLGGVGKTQLAIEYVHRHRGDYDLVWWVAAEDPAEIRRSLVELAGQLETPVTGDTLGTIRRVHEALEERRKAEHWLLIFDNIGDPESVRGLLPSPRHGHVLVTTRENTWSDQGRAVQVDKFTRSESVALLERHGGLRPADADTLADRLGDLPISLAQAAAWHTETREPVTEYLRLFTEELERRQETDALGYPRHAAAAMSIAFNQLSQSFGHAAQLLQLASYFGPEWISLDLLHRGRLATPFSRRLSRTLRDQAPLERAVKEIARWELARNDTRNSRFQIHRLVQRMVQAEMDGQLQVEVRETVQTMLAYANPGNPDRINVRERDKHAELSAHITASGVIESDDDEARQVVLDQIRFRYLVGDYESSRDLAADALAIWEARFDPEDELTLIARRHRANAIQALGFAEEALEIDQDVLAGFQRAFGPDHEHTMATVNSVSQDFRVIGRYAEARDLSQDNYPRHVRVLGRDDRATIRTANNLGVDLRLVGDYENALVLDEETLATAQRAYGPSDELTLLMAGSVAADLYALGRYGEAYRLLRENIGLYEAAVGTNHPHVIRTRRTMVMSLRKMGQARDAAEEFRSLRLAFRNRLGADHPNTLLVAQSFMNALRDNGELVEAIKVGEEALRLYQERSPDHPMTHVCATNLAIAYRQSGNVAGARELNRAALDRLTVLLGPDHPYTLCCATNLANDLAAAGEVNEALRMSGEVLERSRRVRGADQLYSLVCAVNHAIDLIASGDERTGEPMLRNAVDAMLRLPDFGEAHPDVRLAHLGKRIDCDIESAPV
ncbi:hypothetical protein Q0Z83_044460 [Actinoplanes sichuanensis]|uniref:FxSxx-COOH system tetratricopeptide repeat protein n=1 Tax=Actinoplanes sichuanensis TaxID=512349 RepID=A0ABW4AN54_9ACTN|nr:FxSxx-COOH system tetratricopeptide repeat protein [Actinoplanes sichuanensis]BEL06255.1 hypothetical protein Q0Z83_044460 [Actinoplanes sichuanensis]